MDIVRNVGKWGNSAGVLLPKEWVGNQVKIICIDRTLEIKKEVLRILEPYLEDILGIYLTGSYARNEQEEDSDIDIIVITNNTKKEITSGKYHLSISPLKAIKKTIKSNPELVLPRLFEAKTILNKSLLEEIRNEKIKKSSFKNFIKGSKRIIKINGELIRLSKELKDEFLDQSIIYSLVLRLRGVFLVNLILKKDKYSKKIFLKELEKITQKEGNVYEIYKNARDGKKSELKLDLSIGEKLLNKLEEEINKLDNKIRK